ncbi:unnamed protein product, partial [Ectocarpus sp. 12 AP-2014]
IDNNRPADHGHTVLLRPFLGRGGRCGQAQPSPRHRHRRARRAVARRSLRARRPPLAAAAAPRAAARNVSTEKIQAARGLVDGLKRVDAPGSSAGAVGGLRAGGFAVQHARPRVGAGMTGGDVHRPGHGKHHQVSQQEDGRNHFRPSRAQGQAHAGPLPARSRLGSGGRLSG